MLKFVLLTKSKILRVRPLLVYLWKTRDYWNLQGARINTNFRVSILNIVNLKFKKIIINFRACLQFNLATLTITFFFSDRNKGRITTYVKTFDVGFTFPLPHFCAQAWNVKTAVFTIISLFIVKFGIPCTLLCSYFSLRVSFCDRYAFHYNGTWKRNSATFWKCNSSAIKYSYITSCDMQTG